MLAPDPDIGPWRKIIKERTLIIRRLCYDILRLIGRILWINKMLFRYSMFSKK